MPSGAPQLLVKRDRSGIDPISVAAPKAAWRYIGWLGVLLIVVGGIDIVLRWYPTAFRSTEWEFVTVSITVGSLPLFSIGVVALLSSFLARGVKIGVQVMAVAFVLLSVFIAGALILFVSDVPIALKTVTGGVSLELKKTIVRTLVMGVAFGCMYVGSAVVSFRYLFRRVKDV